MIAKGEVLVRRSGVPLRLGGVVLCSGVMAITAGVVHATLPYANIYWAYSFLALRSLDFEATKVIRTLEAGNLPAARKQLGMIVGRDTAHLDEAGIVRAVVETVSENFGDGVVAPVFYLALLGPVGMAVYKAVNTLDSMVGYMDERYRELGWASARLDDVLNFIPARLAALTVWSVAGLVRLNSVRSVRVTLRDAQKQPSPNSGWPEAAFAGCSRRAAGWDEHVQRRGESQGAFRATRASTRLVDVRRCSAAVVASAFLLLVKVAIWLVTHGGAVFVAARELQCDWREILDFSASINPLGPALAYDRLSRTRLIASCTIRIHMLRTCVQRWPTNGMSRPERIMVGQRCYGTDSLSCARLA
jgi:cobalamin biosynthesis protein CobD